MMMIKKMLPINAKNRKVGRFIEKVRTEIQRAFIEEGMTQAEVAKSLGVNRAIVNRRLKGDMNITLRTIGEMAWALGDREIVFELKKPTVPREGWNHEEVGGITVIEPDAQTKIEMV